MTQHPGRVVGGFALLLGVWVVTYWLWTPSAPRITFGDAPPLVQDAQAPSPGRGGGQPAAQPTVLPEPAPGPRMVQRLEPPRFREYTVQKGDTSWDAVSKRVYGDTKWASAISRANPFVSPDKLKVGKTKLKIPVDPTNIQGKLVWVPEEAARPAEPDSKADPKTGDKPDGSKVPVPGPGSSWPMQETTHTVRSGETLTSIAAKYYSAPAGYLKIYNANRDVLSSPDKVKPGMVLRIPPGP